MTTTRAEDQLLQNPDLNVRSHPATTDRPAVSGGTEVLPGWWLYSETGDVGAAVQARRGHVRLLGNRGTRLAQPLAGPSSHVRLTASVRVVVGALLVGATTQRTGPPPALFRPVDAPADQAWQDVDTSTAGPVDQVVLYCAEPGTVADIRSVALSPTVWDRGTAPDVQRSRPIEVGTSAAFVARIDDGPGVPEPAPNEGVSVTSVTCPGGNAAEPGARFTVSGTLSSPFTKVTNVTVSCEGRTYTASHTEDSFTADVRRYAVGAATIEVTASAVSYYGDPRDERNGTPTTAANPRQ